MQPKHNDSVELEKDLNTNERVILEDGKSNKTILGHESRNENIIVDKIQCLDNRTALDLSENIMKFELVCSEELVKTNSFGVSGILENSSSENNIKIDNAILLEARCLNNNPPSKISFDKFDGQPCLFDNLSSSEKSLVISTNNDEMKESVTDLPLSTIIIDQDMISLETEHLSSAEDLTEQPSWLIHLDSEADQS